MTDVSVIVPTFSRPELLARALKSLAAQTLDRSRFDVVVVNDCGLDPADVVARFHGALQITLVTTPENSGLAATRNLGIARSAGRFLSFLDDDDCLYPEHLTLLVDEALARGGETIVYSDAIKLVEDAAGEPLLRHMLTAPATFSYERLLRSNFIHAMSPLVPRVALDVLGGFDETLRALEDWELWLRLGARYDFHHVLRVTADYRVRAGAVNNTTRELPLHVRCTERIYDRYPAPGGSALDREREQYLSQHRQIASQHAFRTSVLIAGIANVQQLQGAVRAAGEEHGSDGVELVAYVPFDAAVDEQGLRVLMQRYEERLVVVRGANLPPEAVHAVLERKAAGQRIERILAASDTPLDTAPPTQAREAQQANEDAYCIEGGYRIRRVPEYYADTPTNILWQPDVYPEAERIARIVGASTIIDIGSGNGGKLVAAHPEFAIIGLDLGTNLDHVRAHHPQGTWIEHDLEVPGPLPLSADQLEGSIIICADVIEHLMRPEHLLAKLHGAFEAGAAAVLLSTPERRETWGARHLGPPPNTCHVREWTLAELGELLEREGFDFGDLDLTRSNDADPRLATSLAVLYRDGDIEQQVRAVRDGVTRAA